MKQKIINEIMPKNNNSLVLVHCSLAENGFLSYDQNDPNYLWLDKKAEENRNSTHSEKRTFYGYYTIPPKEMMKHSRYYLNFAFVSPNHKDVYTTEEVITGRKEVLKRLKTLNAKELPDGDYNISFGIVNNLNNASSIDNSDIGNPSYISFTINDDKLLIDEGWGINRNQPIDVV